MNKKQLIIVVWAVALLLNGCATLGLSPLKDRMLQSVKYSKGELATADAENQAIVSKYGTVDDPPAIARLDSIKNRLESVLPRKDIDFNIHILNSKDVNAMTTGGRHIYVFKGLLNIADNDDELACIIAHEMAHSLSRHRAKMTTISVATALGSIVAGAVTAGQSSAQTIVSLSAQVLPATFSRADEKEADVLAASFAYQAGYDILKARYFFKRLAERERSYNNKVNTELLPVLNMATANYNIALNSYNSRLYYYRNWPNANNYNGLLNAQNQLSYYYNQLQKAKGDYLNFSLGNIWLFRTHPDSMSRANLFVKLSDYMRGLISAESLKNYDKQAVNILDTLKEVEGFSSQGFMNQNGVKALELFKKAKVLYDNKKYEAAESLLKEVLILKPDYQEAVRLQADLVQLIKNKKDKN